MVESTHDDDDLRLLMNALIEQVVARVQAEQWLDICDDCFIRDTSVHRQDQFSDEKDEVHLYLCDSCSKKRKDQAEQVLQDLQCLAREVEQRLEAIENTERELDQWRDDQLQKNRDFWDGQYCSLHTSHSTIFSVQNIDDKWRISLPVVFEPSNMNSQ